MLSQTMMVNVVRAIPTMSTFIRLLLSNGFSLLFAGTMMLSFDLQVSSTVSAERTNDYRRDYYFDLRRDNVDRLSRRRMNADDDLILEQDLSLPFNRMIKSTIKDNIGSYYVHNHSVVATTNRLSILDDLLMIQNEEDIESLHRIMISNVSNSSKRCVRNQNELEITIKNSPDYSIKPTNINLCKEYMNLDASASNNITGEHGIHVINKFINFRCAIKRSNRKCIIDARQKSRHLVIINSTLIFNRITFRNGKEERVNKTMAWGGSLLINTSNIVINNCDFVNNIVNDVGDYAYGGAVGCNDCNMKLVNVNMINNSAFVGGAFNSLGNNVQMSNVTFINNSAFFVRMYNNIFQLYHCRFICLKKKKHPIDNIF